MATATAIRVAWATWTSKEVLDGTDGTDESIVSSVPFVSFVSSVSSLLTLSQPCPNGLSPPSGGYRSLVAYQLATIVHDGTMPFTKLYVDKKSRTIYQMVQAARSGKQNIAESSKPSGTSSNMELILIAIACFSK